MDNTELIGLSQQTALRRHLDIIANNLANMSTPGFRGEQPIFSEYIMPIAEDTDLSGAAALISYVDDPALFRDFQPGRMKLTGNPLDVAINGEGWFAVETADGERYTRAGNFSLDADGRLVTMAGDPVLGDGGPIVFEPQETGVAIAADGTISTDAGEKGRIRVVTFADQSQLVKEGSGLFSSPLPPVETATARVSQGVVEQSNVNAIEQITEMIRVTRTYEATARILAQASQLREGAIETLGTVSA